MHVMYIYIYIILDHGWVYHLRLKDLFLLPFVHGFNLTYTTLQALLPIRRYVER